MRILATISILIIFGGFVAIEQANADGEPFAVVELFASEGCSSCPPADKLLSQITADARKSGKHIYTLSFEVDYWDYLGWKDPFSNALFTQRQHQYARIFSDSSVYTPQMIINGREAFVGSDRPKAEQYIAKYLNVYPENSITLNIDQSGNDLKVNYLCTKSASNSVINFSLVERGIESHVSAGENSGRTLLHDNIVREFKTIDFKEMEGTVIFSKPQEDHLSRFSVIAFVQSQQDMSISAASGIDLK